MEEKEEEEEEVKRQKLTVVSQVYRRFNLCSDSLLAQTDKYLAYLTRLSESRISVSARKEEEEKRRKSRKSERGEKSRVNFSLA